VQPYKYSSKRMDIFDREHGALKGVAGHLELIAPLAWSADVTGDLVGAKCSAVISGLAPSGRR